MQHEKVSHLLASKEWKKKESERMRKKYARY